MPKLGAAQRSSLKQRLKAKFEISSLAGRGPLLTREDLPRLHAYGMEIGNHTSSHVHCRALDSSELRAEAGGAKLELERLSGRSVRAFALPYGNPLDLTADLLDSLRSTGHKAVFLVGARSNRFRPAADIWYRVSLPDVPSTSLPRRLTLYPLLRSLRGMAKL